MTSITKKMMQGGYSHFKYRDIRHAMSRQWKQERNFEEALDFQNKKITVKAKGQPSVSYADDSAFDSHHRYK